MEKDSVNVFDFPLAQVVTNINLQHKNFLKKKTLNEIIHQDVGFLSHFTKNLHRETDTVCFKKIKKYLKK